MSSGYERCIIQSLKISVPIIKWKSFVKVKCVCSRAVCLELSVSVMWCVTWWAPVRGSSLHTQWTPPRWARRSAGGWRGAWSRISPRWPRVRCRRARTCRARLYTLGIIANQTACLSRFWWFWFHCGRWLLDSHLSGRHTDRNLSVATARVVHTEPWCAICTSGYSAGTVHGNTVWL